MVGWVTKVIALATLQYIAPSYGSPLPLDVDSINGNYLDAGSFAPADVVSDLGAVEGLNEDEKLQQIGNYLTELLLLPWNGKGLPILYVEDESEDRSIYDGMDYSQGFDQEMAHRAPLKRSRFYRKYPWKRQNARAYDAENRYLCQPSKDDVFRLIIALHDTRVGSKGRTINFCNRKRPATVIFSNIRFLG
ncbi:PREDICTED: uncharacterized protein LOC108565013 [Nicrophorus vespilloides]|uniref:Uncharacterized protein LOC108565013 n=1 Tax=Nicrophorus vespilloides TaxID=110193 RepID=A0ABM1MYS7_NICVS|nr:PREDICTED: uncharacterized protein LOC108565013 [Nicrophorus vespilloides]